MFIVVPCIITFTRFLRSLPPCTLSWFRAHRPMQVTLLFLAAIATGLVIGDAVLMPAFSGEECGCS